MLMLCSGNTLFAQVKYQITNYNVEYTKGGNQNWDVALDSKQRVYIANNFGLIVFDNASTQLYSLPEKTIVRSVAVVNDTVYTGSFEELGYWTYNTENQLVYTSLIPNLVDPISPNDEFWQIVEHNGYIYFHTFGGLFVYDHKQVRRLSNELSGFMFLYPVDSIVITQKINGGLYTVNGHELKPISGTETLGKEELKSAISLGDNRALLATTLGLYELNISTGTLTEIKSKSVSELIQSKINYATQTDSYLVFGTILDGIYLFSNDGNYQFLSRINTSKRLQNNTVLSLEKDQNQNIWVGLDKGIDYIAFNSPIDSYRDENPKVGSVYTAALMNGKLYVGSNQGLYEYIQDVNGKFVNGKLVENSQGQVWFLRVIDGYLYAGLNRGTYVLDNHRLIQVSDVIGAYNLKDYSTNPNIKIQSTYSQLVRFQKEGKFWKKSGSISGFSSPTRFLEFDHLGTIWAGHSIKNIRQLQPNIELDSIESTTIIGENQHVYESTNRIFKLDNRIIVSTSNALLEWDSIQNRFHPFRKLDSLFTVSGSVMNIVPAGNYRYWIIKKQEVLLAEVRFDQVQLLYRMLPKVYDFHLLENYERIIPISDNLHLVCLDDGFSIINLDVILRTETPISTPVIGSIDVIQDNGMEKQLTVEPNESYVFSNDENSVTFNWTSSQPIGHLSYFQYRLLGHESEWSNWTINTKATYERLNSGVYFFEVRTLSTNGLLSSTSRVELEINEAWYKSSIGYVIYAFILGLITLLIRFSISKKRWKALGKQLEQERKQMQLEKEMADKEIISLRNDKLQVEIEHKSSQLAANTMAIIRKNELLNTIKDELSIQKDELGDRFPKKYYNKIVSLIDRNLQDEKEWETFEQLYDQAHGNFFKRLKDEYPDLTPGDLRLCAYLRMNLASKEIAPLLNISVRGVEERRYRLRKRLNLNSDTNLTEMLMTY